MSAQDDVLAAFGEPRRRVVEPEPEQLEPESEPEPEPETVADETLVSQQNGADPGESEEDGEASESPAEDEPGEPTVEDEPSVAVAEDEAGHPAVEAAVAVDAVVPQPYLDPSAFFTQLQAESAPKKRRWPRLVVRYGTALVLAGAVGAGTAYAVTIPRRTDVPFLATPSDGRYTFPTARKPIPPAGKPAPADEANSGQVHYGDLRQYLIPIPKGAAVKEDGWEPVTKLTDTVTGGTDLTGQLYDAGLRRIAWRGWTAADGQHTVVELLQFPDHAAAYSLLKSLRASAPRSFLNAEAQDVLPLATVPLLGDSTEDVTVNKFDAVDALPGQVGKRAVFEEGDVVVILTTTAPETVTDVPTKQVMLLQAEMLR